jgi:hypothetical protein
MLRLKHSGHLRTMRHLKSFRSCPTSTGIPRWQVEAWRLLQEAAALENRMSYSRTLARIWRRHLERASQGRAG